ncbi:MULTISPECIES: hypothetical protein [Nocardia]|uniref:hypothetical protein n=1 Tax=Nocardia TaxID=1817 RepID=UPI0024572D67|nr:MULTISPECIES: hypothetical protein [Nocardia]
MPDPSRPTPDCGDPAPVRTTTGHEIALTTPADEDPDVITVVRDALAAVRDD